MMSKGTWASTVAFLIIGLIFTIVSSIMGGLNAFSNPIEWIVGVHGLLIWNSVAGEYRLANIHNLMNIVYGTLFILAFCYFLVMCCFGGEFNSNLRKVAPISELLRSGDNIWNTKGQASLGYSYWY